MTKAKKKEVDLSAIATDKIAGYWFKIEDGKDAGKYLFNDLLGTIPIGYVDNDGTVHRYFYLSNSIITNYSRISSLPAKLVEFTKLSEGHTLLVDETLIAEKAKPKYEDLDWNTTFVSRRQKYNDSQLWLEDGQELMKCWLTQMVSGDYIYAYRVWQQTSLGDRHRLVLDCQEANPKTTISVEKIDRFFEALERVCTRIYLSQNVYLQYAIISKSIIYLYLL